MMQTLCSLVKGIKMEMFCRNPGLMSEKEIALSTLTDYKLRFSSEENDRKNI